MGVGGFESEIEINEDAPFMFWCVGRAEENVLHRNIAVKNTNMLVSESLMSYRDS
jgi:hypothetical protein